MALLAGAAHGHIREFSASAVGQHVGGVDGGALAAIGGDGIPPVDFARADVVRPEGELLAVRSDRLEGALFGVDRGDSRGLGGDPRALGSRT